MTKHMMHQLHQACSDLAPVQGTGWLATFQPASWLMRGTQQAGDTFNPNRHDAQWADLFASSEPPRSCVAWKLCVGRRLVGVPDLAVMPIHGEYLPTPAEVTQLSAGTHLHGTLHGQRLGV